MRALKVIGKILLALVAALVVLALVVMGLRAYNHHTYPVLSEGTGEGSGADESASISTARIAGEGMNGMHLTPEEKTHPGVVVLYGGSEGGRDTTRAAWLAGEGFEVLSMHFFGQDNQEPLLANVPLEQFDEHRAARGWRAGDCHRHVEGRGIRGAFGRAGLRGG